MSLKEDRYSRSGQGRGLSLEVFLVEKRGRLVESHFVGGEMTLVPSGAVAVDEPVIDRDEVGAVIDGAIFNEDESAAVIDEAAAIVDESPAAEELSK